MPSDPEEEVTTDDLNRSLRSAQRDRTRLAEELVTVQETLREDRHRLDQTQQQLVEALAREENKMAELAMHLDGAFPQYHGDPTKDRSFASFLSDYKLACDRFGFDEKRSALWLSNSLKGHALRILKDTLKDKAELKEKYTELTQELNKYFKPLTEGKKYGTGAFHLRTLLPGESVVAYFDDLEKLAAEICPDETKPMDDDQLMMKFIGGLPRYLQEKVIPKDPASSRDALKHAVKAQAQHEFVRRDEPSVNKVHTDDKLTGVINELVVAVNALRTENPYTRQQQAQPRIETERPGWPNPAHHLPPIPPPQPPMEDPAHFYQYSRGPRQRAQAAYQAPPARAPRNMINGPRNGRIWRHNPPKPNYNKNGEPLCWQCLEYGHMRMSCPKPKQQQRAPVRQVEAQETEDGLELELQESSGGGGGGQMRHPYMYLAVVATMCVFMMPIAAAQRPMICPMTSPGQLFALPKPLECNMDDVKVAAAPVPRTLNLFKQNLMKYEVGGWACRGVKQTTKVLTYFFGDEHLEQHASQTVGVTPEECRRMVSSGFTEAGPFVNKPYGVLATDNKFTHRLPRGGLPECCRWHEYSITNYFATPIRVYKQHGRKNFECTGADVTSCPGYFNNACQLDEMALVWTANETASCNYLFFKEMAGWSSGNSWISKDNQLALTFSQSDVVKDCGNSVKLSDQGIPYQVVDKENRTRRELEEQVGVVTSDQLAGELEALYLRIREEQAFAYQRLLQDVCGNMQSTSLGLRVMAVSQPTQTVRELLNNSYLIGRAGVEFVEVWSCLPISKEGFKTLPQTESCTRDISIEFQFQNQTSRGYLDPVDLRVTHHGEPADCGMVSTTPSKLLARIHNYNRRSGDLVRILKPKSLLPLQHQLSANQSLMQKPLVFCPVTMYSWKEKIGRASCRERV